MKSESQVQQLIAEMVADGLRLEVQRVSKCKLCDGIASLFDVVDFKRSCHEDHYPAGVAGIPIYYQKCDSCGLVFTRAFDEFSSHAWVKYIYNREYFSDLDPDYQIHRPTLNAEVVRAIGTAMGKRSLLGVDYGGGNGSFATLMRESGFTFFTHDPFASSDLVPTNDGKYTLVTSFEVLEHTVDPLETMEDILRLVGPQFVLVCSTQTLDGLASPAQRLNWHYFAPRNGHVTIYSRASLSKMAKIFSLDYLSVSRGLHLFGRGVSLFPLKYVAGLVKLKQRIQSKFV